MNSSWLSYSTFFVFNSWLFLYFIMVNLEMGLAYKFLYNDFFRFLCQDCASLMK